MALAKMTKANIKAELHFHDFFSYIKKHSRKTYFFLMQRLIDVSYK